jgi:hypothetical protein
MIKNSVLFSTKKGMDIRDQNVFRLWEGATKKVNKQNIKLTAAISITYKI